MASKGEKFCSCGLPVIKVNGGGADPETLRSLNMVANKSSAFALQQENRRNLQTQSSVEDLPDSPISEDRDKIEETVIWSNAAFVSHDMMNDIRSSTTSLSSSTCINKVGDFSVGNSSQREEAHSRNSQLIRKPSHHHRHVGGNEKNQGYACWPSMARAQSQVNTPVMKESLLPKNVSFAGCRPEMNLKKRMETMAVLENRMSMSEAEAKIKAELEKEIEKDLEEEIKDGILVLTRRLAELHARQKFRNEENQRSHFETKWNIGFRSDNGPVDPWSTPTRRTKSPAVTCGSCRIFRSPEKKFRRMSFGKDFDWVKTLRAGTKGSSTCLDHELTHKKKASEKLRDEHFSPPMSVRKCSRALFTESKNEARRSVSEPRRCQRHGCVHSNNPFHKDDNSIPVKGNGKFNNPKFSPKDDSSCSSTNAATQSGGSRKMHHRKGNVGGEETKAARKGDRGREVAEGNPKQERMFLIDMMNRLRVSVAKNGHVEQAKKKHSSETRILHQNWHG